MSVELFMRPPSTRLFMKPPEYTPVHEAGGQKLLPQRSCEVVDSPDPAGGKTSKIGASVSHVRYLYHEGAHVHQNPRLSKERAVRDESAEGEVLARGLLV
jgi:hypothetical protein